MKQILRAVERLLNKYGYYRCDMPEGSTVSETEMIELFEKYGNEDVFLRLLRDICARDIRLYFQASTDKEREGIRGAYARTNYFISLIKKSNERRNKKRSS